MVFYLLIYLLMSRRLIMICPGRYIAHKFESGWKVGVIKAFDKKGPHAGKVSVKYKDDPNWWTHSLLREGYGKDCESETHSPCPRHLSRPLTAIST